MSNQYHEKIRQEEESIKFMGSLADGYVPDATYKPNDCGKFVKHYSYDYYDEVWLEKYTNGAEVYKGGTGRTWWFYKPRMKEAFELARILGDRSQALNRMMR